MKTIYKIAIIGILLSLVFLTLNAAAYEPMYSTICDCGCNAGTECMCTRWCPITCSCHPWFWI